MNEIFTQNVYQIFVNIFFNFELSLMKYILTRKEMITHNFFKKISQCKSILTLSKGMLLDSIILLLYDK